MVMMKPAFSYGVRDIFIASDPKLENWRCMLLAMHVTSILVHPVDNSLIYAIKAGFPGSGLVASVLSPSVNQINQT